MDRIVIPPSSPVLMAPMAVVIQNHLRHLGCDPTGLLHTEMGREFIASRLIGEIDDVQFYKCIRNMLILNPGLRLNETTPPVR